MFPLSAGKYFAVMQSMPQVSATAFAGLQRLFDLYFFTVVTSFVPQLALHSLFSHFEALESAQADSLAPGAGRTAPAAAEDVDAYPYRDPMCTMHLTCPRSC
jgi:hypothetical protein